MVKKIGWILFGLMAILIGLYPWIYFLVHDKGFGLLGTKAPELLSDPVWNAAFYTHIIPGGLSLMIGWTQFSPTLRRKKMSLHRAIGKIYVIAALLSGVAGLYIAFFATGGLISALGFSLLAVLWFSTTLSAWLAIRKLKINLHQMLMIYSYALCFAAVTLRIWLPILVGWFGDFTIAYQIVAWLSWVPNLVVAYFLTRKIRT